jgi:cytochrome P450
MTLEVIGTAAFGVDFITEGDEQDLKEGKPNLVAAVKAIFSAGNFTPSNGAGVVFRLVPDWMEPLFFVLFLRLFGPMARKLEYARSTLMSTADLLMQAARKQAVARGEEVHMVQTDWRWWSQDWADQNPYKGVTPAPNSVLDMLMRATNKETGRGLLDVQIAAQSNTLIAAGYETTANAIAFAIFCLATHPEAEARLLAEVDAFGTDKV